MVLCKGWMICQEWQFVSAGARGDLITLDKFLTSGMNPNIKSTIGGVTALRLAIQNERWYTVKMLLAKGADPNSGLQSAISKGRLDIIKMLVDKGANVNAKSDYSFSPLQRAIKYGDRTIINYLHSKGARE